MLTLEEIESQKLSVEERTKCLEKMIQVYLSCIYCISKKKKTNCSEINYAFKEEH